jgi:hypothetical protein
LQREKHALIQLLIVVLRMATTNNRLVRKNAILDDHVLPIVCRLMRFSSSTATRLLDKNWPLAIFKTEKVRVTICVRANK